MENSQKKGQGGEDTSTCTELSKPSTLKPFLILIGVFVLMQLTGTYAVIFYAVTVFRVSKVLRVVFGAQSFTSQIQKLTGGFLPSSSFFASVRKCVNRIFP